jgi:hypothetical protein
MNRPLTPRATPSSGTLISVSPRSCYLLNSDGRPWWPEFRTYGIFGRIAPFRIILDLSHFPILENLSDMPFQGRLCGIVIRTLRRADRSAIEGGEPFAESVGPIGTLRDDNISFSESVKTLRSEGLSRRAQLTRLLGNPRRLFQPGYRAASGDFLVSQYARPEAGAS